MNLADEYRPRVWGDLVGQNHIRAVVDRLRARRGLHGRAFVICGKSRKPKPGAKATEGGAKSGTGKTTVAMLIAYEVANGQYIRELGAGDLTAAKLLDEERDMRYVPIKGDGHVRIVNEFHRLTPGATAQLLDILERLSPIVTWIFTSTVDTDCWARESCDKAAFFSRCLPLRLTTQGLAIPFAKRLREIATTEGLNGRPESAYVSLVNRCRGNFREALQAIEAGEMLA